MEFQFFILYTYDMIKNFMEKKIIDIIVFINTYKS